MAREKWQKKIESERRHKAAFVDTIKGPVLLKNLLSGSRNQVIISGIVFCLFYQTLPQLSVVVFQ